MIKHTKKPINKIRVKQTLNSLRLSNTTVHLTHHHYKISNHTDFRKTNRTTCKNCFLKQIKNITRKSDQKLRTKEIKNKKQKFSMICKITESLGQRLQQTNQKKMKKQRKKQVLQSSAASTYRLD